MKPIQPLRSVDDYYAWEEQDRQRIDEAVKNFHRMHRDAKPVYRPRWLLLVGWSCIIIFAGCAVWFFTATWMGMTP
jgi:hypothetical protein